MIKIENQPIVFNDNCEVEVCACGNQKCDKFAFKDGRFAFQFTNLNNQFGEGTEPDIDILNYCDDTEIDTIDAADFANTEEIVTANGKWSDYITDDGCYYFRLNDVQMALNRLWATNFDDWTALAVNATWSSQIPGARLTGTGLGGGSVEQIYENICTKDAVISVDVFTLASPTIKYFVNNVEVSSFTAGYNVPDGTIIESIRIEVSGLNNAEVVDFTNFSFTNSYDSNPICVYDTLDFCNIDIEAYSTADHSDFEFATSGFKFYLALKGAISNPRYPTEEEIYLSSAGQNTLVYARSEKHYDLLIDRCMEDTWDAITSIMMCDYIYINGTRYVKVEGDIEPKWSRSNKYLAGGTITIKKHTENRKK
jgi:hypothetical protein